jgi:hypothetical protein
MQQVEEEVYQKALTVIYDDDWNSEHTSTLDYDYPEFTVHFGKKGGVEAMRRVVGIPSVSRYWVSGRVLRYMLEVGILCYVVADDKPKEREPQ